MEYNVEATMFTKQPHELIRHDEYSNVSPAVVPNCLIVLIALIVLFVLIVLLSYCFSE